MARTQEEPLVIGPEVVVDFLESHDRPRMAEYVRGIAQRNTFAYQREQALKDEYSRLLERLRKYEPKEDTRESGPTWTGD